MDSFQPNCQGRADNPLTRDKIMRFWVSWTAGEGHTGWIGLLTRLV